MKSTLHNTLLWCALFVCGCLLGLVVESPSGVAQSSRYSVVQPAREWQFPRDHGAHPGFQTEWWYITGQLFNADSTPFNQQADYGFQLTFFRRGLTNQPSPNAQALLAHAALTDVRAKQFQFEKRYQRLGLGVGKVSEDTMHLELSSWSIVPETHTAGSEQYRMRWSVQGAQLDITATFKGKPMLQGEAGFSRKGSCEECASYYYSLPRLELRGTITRNGVVQAVHGIGWMDHEFMSAALSESQVGWDWLSLMHRDGRNVMVFRLRARKKEEERSACLEFTAPNQYRSCKVTFAPLPIWRSPASGAPYPGGYSLTLKFESSSENISVAPLIENQELHDASMSYYEGAVESADRAWIGYLEMTGYDKPLKQRL